MGVFDGMISEVIVKILSLECSRPCPPPAHARSCCPMRRRR